MPGEAYEQLKKITAETHESFMKGFEDYLGSTLDAETSEDMDEGLYQLPMYTKQTKTALFFLTGMMRIFSRDIYKENTNLGHSESYYNDILIHPSIRIMVLALDDAQGEFIPGEEQLSSMSIQLKRRDGTFDEKSCYKADGIIQLKLNTSQMVEIFLLKTSGGYAQATNNKNGFDHHKATFGLLAMIKTLVDMFEMGSFHAFSKIKLYFLHVYDTKMRLWSLCSPKQSIYVLNREWSVIVPAIFNRRESELLDYIRYFWDLKEKIQIKIANINKLKEKHVNNMRNIGLKNTPTLKVYYQTS